MITIWIGGYNGFSDFLISTIAPNIMKYLLILCLLFCLSCSSVHYVSPDGSELDYTRILGKQNLKNFKVEIVGDDGVKKTVKFDSSTGDNTAMAEVLKNMTELLLKAAP